VDTPEEAMRNPIRRQAGQYRNTAWWLVPIAFAAAALAAVAINDAETAAAAPPPLPLPQAVSAPVTPALPQPADSVIEVTEHVQAF
jgi:hypothetical protein